MLILCPRASKLAEDTFILRHVYFHLTLTDKCSFKQLMFCLSMVARWEMQEGAELEDGEKSMVEELQRAYFVCCCSPRPQDPPEADETLAEQTRGETQPSDKSAAQ